MDNDDHPAGNWTATRSIGGYSDWYLPAFNELAQHFANRASIPADEYDGWYTWTSTESSTGCAFAYNLTCGGGAIFPFNKTSTNVNVRAFRRVPV
jgi:hypothetical protein